LIGALGLGAVSPFGVGVAPLGAALRGEIASGEPDDRWGITSRLGIVPGFKARKMLPDRKAIKVMSRDAQLAVVAALEACGTNPSATLGIDPGRFGAFGAAGYEAAALSDVLDMMVASRDSDDPCRLSISKLYGDGRDAYHPLAPLKTLPNMALFHVGMSLGLRGPQLALGSSAAAGIAALGEACEALQYGEADAALVVATDSMVRLSRIEAMVEAGMLPGETWPAEGAAAVLLGEGGTVRVLAWDVGQAPVGEDEPAASYGRFDAGDLPARVLAAAGVEAVQVSVRGALGFAGAAEGLLGVVAAMAAVRDGVFEAAQITAVGLAGDVASVVVGAA
jgi:3-oxoacyl-(acyl-carrier-protein) synthase